MNNTDISNNHTIINFDISQDFEQFDFSDKFVSVGSCFADEISTRLKKSKIDSYVNPFGTIYNPVSIYNVFQRNFDTKTFSDNDILQNENKYFTQYHSTIFDSNQKQKTLSEINKNLEKSQKHFNNADVFLITYGTAVVYYYQNILMANCHKVDQKYFTRKILSADDICLTTEKIIQLIRKNRPDAKIIFTISPVRHKNPDLLTNSYSKAVLKVGLTESLAKCSDKNVTYFPSYEIAIDQLRDYTFYQADGVHLTDFAVDYIYDRFLTTFFTQPCLSTINHVNKLVATFKHKSSDKTSLSYFDNLMLIYNAIQNIREKNDTNQLNKLSHKIIKKALKYFYKNEFCLQKLISTKTFCEKIEKYNNKIQKWSKNEK